MEANAQATNDALRLQVALTPAQHLHISQESAPGFYYLLRRSQDVGGAYETVALDLGMGGEATFLSEEAIDGLDRGFFHTRRVPEHAPLDSDADGLPDPFELRHPGILGPLSPEDPKGDPDDDGLTNREEYAAGTDPETANPDYPWPRFSRALNSVAIENNPGVEAVGAMAVGDFNVDGHIDLLMADQEDFPEDSVGLAVLLGRGDGTFGPPGNIDFGGRTASAVMATDLDADGHPDAVVVDSENERLTLLWGNGDGTFSDSTSLAVGNPYDVAFGYFDADARPDLATGNDEEVLVFLNQGDRVFASEPIPSPHGLVSAFAFASADFNGDGFRDLALVDGAFYGTLSVLFGHGDGGFREPLIVSLDFEESDGPVDLAVGDLNRDGSPDIVTVDEDQDSVAVVLNNGNEGFHTPHEVPVGSNPKAIVVEDFNQDGNLDVAVANRGGRTVSLLQGNGHGHLEPLAPLVINNPIDDSPRTLVVGEFNGDGFADLAVGVQNNTTQAAILLNQVPANLPRVHLDLAWTKQIGTSGGDGVIELVALRAGGVVLLSVQNDVATLTRMNASGEVLWSKGLEAASEAAGVAVDERNPNELRIYALATTRNRHAGSLSWHYSSLAGNEPRGGISDLILYRFDGSGGLEGAEQFGSTGDDVARDVAVGPEGAVFVAGDAHGAFTPYPASPVPEPQQEPREPDIMVARFAEGKAMVWTRLVGSIADPDVFGNDNSVAAMTVSEETGNVLVTGFTDATLANAVLDGGSEPSSSHDAAGSGRLFVVEFAASSEFLRVRQIGATGQDRTAGVVAHPNGGFSLVGSTEGQVLPTALAPDTEGPLVAHWSMGGALRFVRQDAARNGANSLTAAAVDAAGRLYAVGEDFGSENAFLSIYDSQGRLLKNDFEEILSESEEPGVNVGARAVAVAEDGTVYLAGNTDGNFAGENRGGSDIWVGRLEITFD